MNKCCSIFALLFISQFSAQNAALSQAPPYQSPSGEPMNIVKTNLAAYLFRNVNFSYERIFTQRFSLVATYSFMPAGPVPYVKTIASGSTLKSAQQANVSYQSYTLEPRFYANKNGYGTGFYVAPYYRHSSVDVSGYTLNYSVGDIEESAIMSGKVTGNSLGVLIGTQWAIGAAQRWMLDLSMLGAHYGVSKGDLQADSNRTLSPTEQQMLQNELNDLDVPFIKIDAQANDHGATAKVSGPWAGIRFGFSVGYRF